MKFTFTKAEIEVMKKAGITFDVMKSIDNESILEIDELVSEHLIYEGIEEDGTINADGKLCEQIIEKLSEE
ncbi:MAG: hypothetical protein ACERKN_01470 [Velocimicrobium sp.]